MFPHEKLRAYQVAVEFVALADEIVAAMPKGHSEIAKQLDAAASSISLNIAEASGRRHAKDKAKIFGYARGSATECAANLDVLAVRGLVKAGHRARGRALLDEAARCLAGLERKWLAEG